MSGRTAKARRIPGIAAARKMRARGATAVAVRTLYALGFLVLLLLALASLLPLYWMITGSFKPLANTMSLPPEWFPLHPTMGNYRDLFENLKTLRWFLNSIVVAGGTMIGAVVTSTLAGYAFGKKRFPGQTVLFWLLILTMMLPRQIMLIPLFITMRDLRWIDTYQGLIAPAIAYPFGIFLVKQFMQSIPNELIAAAKIDGASELTLFRLVIMPLTKPAIGVVAIFSFVGGWGDYIWQLIMTNKETTYTLPLGISKLAVGAMSFNLGLSMAGATFAFLPMLAIFLFFQDYFIKGITVGAIKG